MSAPCWSIKPPSAQKSFCMSIATNADRARSMITRFGRAATLSGRGSMGGRVVSTTSSVTRHRLARTVPMGTVPCDEVMPPPPFLGTPRPEPSP